MHHITKSNRVFLIIGAIYALLSVAFGAFGAHALESRLESAGTRTVWETAVDYQMWHALALLLIAGLGRPSGIANAGLTCFAVGIFIFAASLYGLALGGPRWLITGWICILIHFFRMK